MEPNSTTAATAKADIPERDVWVFEEQCDSVELVFPWGTSGWQPWVSFK